MDANFFDGGSANEAKFIFSYGVGCKKKSFMLGVQDVGKIRMKIFEGEIMGMTGC